MITRKRPHSLAEHLPANKVLWALVVQAAVVLPHIAHLPAWILVTAMAVGIWRYHATRRQWRPPSLVLRVLLIGIGSLAVFASYGTLFGRDAGVAMIVMMLALKLLELTRRRDVIVFLLLGYFLVITNFLYSQSVVLALYMFLVTILLTSALAAIDDPGWRVLPSKHIRLAGTLLFQALPMAVLLFLLFPRISGPLWSLPEDAFAGSTGLSDRMSPGSISRLIRSHEVAFRVDFFSPPPAAAAMYWRGPVFEHYDGRTWSGTDSKSLQGRPQRIGRDAVAYQLTLEPTFQRWLIALDTPLLAPAGAQLTENYELRTDQPVQDRRRYPLQSSVSSDQILPVYLSADARQRTLRLPPGDPKTHALAQELRSRHPDTRALVGAVLKRFHEQPYVYSLQPPPLQGADPVDQFLFETRKGFCEHYASAFAILLRAAGIPTRVVTGYQGAEFNDTGDYWIVRQSDAHAWTEVWLDGEGWWRVDPTAAIAPTRIEAGIEAALPEQVTRYGFVGTESALLRKIGLFWDSANNSWNQWVIGYGADKQLAFLQQLGFEKPRWVERALIAAAAVTIALLLLAAGLAFRHRPVKEHPSVRAYKIFGAKLARAGIERHPSETPRAFAERVSASFPERQQEVQRITELYIGIRYQQDHRERSIESLRHLVRQFSLGRTGQRKRKRSDTTYVPERS